jgi:cephalosporin hydroxylase
MPTFFERLQTVTHTISVLGRHFDSAVPRKLLDSIQSGVMKNSYRGIPLLKSPFDICLYMQLISRLKPLTVLEIGTKFGGSALWFADMLTTHGLAGRVVTVDINPRVQFSDDRIVVKRGDARSLDKVFTDSFIDSLARPWLVVEDSAHLFDTTLAVLRYFDQKLVPGDYIVIEDGVLSYFSGRRYREYKDGPNLAVKEFLSANGDRYSIDTTLCDHFGYNVTYNPNGWLKRR